MGRIASAFVGGVVFNVANLGLCKSIDMMGLAVAFPLCIGMALVVGTVVNYAIAPSGNVFLLMAGIIFGLAAVCGVAFVQVMKEREMQAKEKSTGAAAGDEVIKPAAAATSSETAEATNPAVTTESHACDVDEEKGTSMAQKASESSQTQLGKTASNQSTRTNAAEATFCRKMVVTVLSGALMSFWNPLSVLAINSDLKTAGQPLTPYGEYLIFCLALMLSTLMLVPAILAHPLEGGAAMPLAPA